MRTRGFTLIELLVAIALASIIFSAATVVVVGVLQNRRLNLSRLEVKTSSAIAASLMEFDGANAGYRFASPAFSVRVLQNVVGTEAELAPATATANCGGQTSWGIMGGTDVVEFRSSLEVLDGGAVPFVPGVATDVTCTVAGMCDVALGKGIYSNPFSSRIAGDGANEVILFADEINACAAIVSSDGVNPDGVNPDGGTRAQMQAQLVKQDLQTTAGSTVYPNCPSKGMTVMRLGWRRRYMVCAPPSSEPAERPALYRQTIDARGNGVFERVQDGIEDLQVAVRVDNRDALVSGRGCVGVGQGAYCWCDDSASPCVGYTSDATASGALDSRGASPAQKTAYLLRGVKIGVTAISFRAAYELSNATQVRPALYDHPAGTAQSANLRSGTQVTVSLQNLVMVTP